MEARQRKNGNEVREKHTAINQEAIEREKCSIRKSRGSLDEEETELWIAG